MAIINGTPGDDSLNGTSGDDTINGFAGNDVILARQGDDVVDAGDGHDLVRGAEGNDILQGGNGDDYLDGGPGDDVLDGGAGFDRAAYHSSPVGVHVDLGIQGVAQDTGAGFDTLIGIEHLSGTVFDDVLTGNNGDNWIWGEGGNDIINAGGGNDLVEVGPGSAVLDGGSGVDTASFLDQISAVGAAVTVSLALQGGAQNTGEGAMTLTGFENLSGGVANDALTGDGGNNILAGDTGNDTLVGGAGDDTLYGDGRIIIDSHDTGTSGPFITYADLAVLADPTLIDGDDVLEGGLGDDVLWGGGGNDTASYAHASGAVQVGLGNAPGSGFSAGADGNDILHDIENVTGSAFNDQITGNAGANVLSGGDGHDQLRGRDGNDTLLGGNGDDFLNGGNGDDIVDGGSGWDRATFATGAVTGVHVDLNIQGVAQNTGQGNDTLISIEHVSGTSFDDTLIGNGGDNWVWGEGGNDTLSGGGGNDLVQTGAPGNVVADGGAGTDTLSVSDNGAGSAPVTVSLALQGVAQATGIGTYTLTGFENLSGSSAGDTLTGDGGANVLAGDAGNDTLVGGAGDDILYGDGRINVDTHNDGGSGPITTWTDIATLGETDGDDLLEGGLGDDILNGGGGIDTASYAHASGAVQVVLGNLPGSGSSSGADGNDILHDIENITGSAFDDDLIGNAGANVLSGGDGHDQIRGRDGDDTLLGGNGDDFLNGGLGNDLIDGGAGFDRAAFATGAVAGVTVDLNIAGPQNTGQGIDTIVNVEHVSGTGFADTLTGNGGDNWIWGEGGNDVLSAGGGNDLVEVGPGNTVADGGAGTDAISFLDQITGAPAGVTVSLALQDAAQATGEGSMTLSGFENLSGGIVNDVLTGDGGNNVIAGDSGNDTLVGGAGDDTLYGDGRINIDTHGTAGSGPITTFADVAALGEADGDDLLEGGLGDDILNGGGGTDTASYAHASGAVQVGLGNAPGSGFSAGADGNDTLISIENVTGSAFDDTITGNASANLLAGGDGHDQIRGRDGDDTLLGGNGDDFLNGGLGNDIIDGGAGWDRAAFATGATAGVTVKLNIAGAQNTGQGIDTLVNIEHVSGTSFADTLTGNGGDNWLWGEGGNDMLSAGGGNDLVSVGPGNVIADGGAGTDAVSFLDQISAVAAGVTVSLALQGAAQATGEGSMTLTGFENLSGGIVNDTLTGNAANNVIAGDSGNDVLNGGDGDDTLYGDGRIWIDSHGTAGSGPITTFGDVFVLDGEADGNDTLSGGKGNDILVGGGGDDVLSGGAGNDNFVFGAASGHDRITDFANKDHIEFDATSGVHSFSDLTLTASGKDTLISWGTGGDTILVEGMKPKQLSASDFQFDAPAAAIFHASDMIDHSAGFAAGIHIA